MRPETSEEAVGRLAKLLVPVVAGVALAFALTSSLDLVLLALLGFAYVAQLFPSVLFSLMRNDFTTKRGAASGILVGAGIVTYLTIAGITLRSIFPFLGSLGDINVGIVALLANGIVLVVVSFLARPSTVAVEARQRA